MDMLDEGGFASRAHNRALGEEVVSTLEDQNRWFVFEKTAYGYTILLRGGCYAEKVYYKSFLGAWIEAEPPLEEYHGEIVRCFLHTAHPASDPLCPELLAKKVGLAYGHDDYLKRLERQEGRLLTEQEALRVKQALTRWEAAGFPNDPLSRIRKDEECGLFIEATFSEGRNSGLVSSFDFRSDVPKPLWRKIAFLDRKYEHTVKNGEKWLVRILRDTKPEDPRKGALILEPVRKVDY